MSIIFTNGEEKEGARRLQRLAREEMKLKLLADIRKDIIICKIENWDSKEYIRELKELINGLGGLNAETLDK